MGHYRVYYRLDPQDAFPSVWHVAAETEAHAIDAFVVAFCGKGAVISNIEKG